MKYSIPVYGLDTFETYTALNEFKGDERIGIVYCDDYSSYRKAIRKISAAAEHSIPSIHHNNAIIEAVNLDIARGVRVILCQAGLPGCFWTYAAPHYCHIENITQDEEGNSPWFTRYQEPFAGKAIPFGCGVYFLPTKYSNSKAVPSMSYGIFLGYRLAPGGRWNGQYLVADIYDFIGMNLSAYAPETKCWLYPHVTEQVTLTKKGCVFPLKPKYDQISLTLDGNQDTWVENQWCYDIYGEPTVKATCLQQDILGS